MVYQIDEKNIIIDSDGKAILITDEQIFANDTTIGNTVLDLPSNYFTNYFPTPAPQAQGSTYGYLAGGSQLQGQSHQAIERWPFATNANATNIGNITPSHNRYISDQSSTTHGYTSGGYVQNVIDKFPFASTPVTATDVGDLTQSRSATAGQSSTTHGYASGGGGGYSPPPPGYPLFNTIDKFPFSSDTNATDVGDLTEAKWKVGQSSTTHGYTSGGGDSVPNHSNIIDKFPFSTDANATDVGDLTQARTNSGSQSSGTHGYVAGGSDPSNPDTSGTNIIDKFPFSSDGNATDVGDLTANSGNSRAGSSSTADGYTMGGSGGSPLTQRTTIIDKFPFSSDANATDVGDLTKQTRNATGLQV